MNRKEKVLQRCAELRNPSAPWINEEWDLKRYVTTNRWELHRHKGLCDIRYQFSDDVPETDPVWPLAAQVLGIREEEEKGTESPKPDWVKEEIKEMMQPSRQLLWEAFLKGHNAAVPIRKEFNEWIQAIPPDTLKEDRELVRKSVLWDTGDIFEDQMELHMTAMAAPTIEVYEALKRLCGMEVGG